MDFRLSTEQEMIRAMCKNFAKNEIMPIAERLDATGQFPHEVWKKMGGLGICGIPIVCLLILGSSLYISIVTVIMNRLKVFRFHSKPGDVPVLL